MERILFHNDMYNYCCAGIGLATVDRLATEGATVAIFDINKEAGWRVAKELSEKNLKVNFFPVGVANKAACFATTSSFAADNEGKIHYLVNCAGYFGSKSLHAEKNDWEKSFSVNVVGYANMVQACHWHMCHTAGEKSVVNMASVSGHRAQPNRWTYAATKGAILSLTKCMALDLSKDKIRVNSVSPAWVWGPEVSKAAVGGREKWEPIWGPFHMTRRLAECQEVAASICFLLSDDASFITGTDVPVDGGYLSMSAEGHGDNSSYAGAQ